MAKATRKKKTAPVEVFRVGVVLDVCCPGLHLLPATARALGYQSGTYLQVDCDARSTVVVRELVGCNRGCPGMRNDYIYMDRETAHYLGVELHDEVTIKRAEYELDMP